jgi:hypothetical protein
LFASWLWIPTCRTRTFLPASELKIFLVPRTIQNQQVAASKCCQAANNCCQLLASAVWASEWESQGPHKLRVGLESSKVIHEGYQADVQGLGEPIEAVPPLAGGKAGSKESLGHFRAFRDSRSIAETPNCDVREPGEARASLQSNG